MRSNHYSHTQYRHCSRCGKDLTDPPSVERGYGPRCAMQNAKLFSTSLAADFGQVTLYLELIEKDTIPDMPSNQYKNPREEFAAMKAKLAKIAANNIGKAMLEGKNLQAITGTALGDFAKTCDFLCSFKLGLETKQHLVALTRALGYPALAAVLSGEASTGPSKVGFDEKTGELTLVGSKTKAGYAAFVKIKHLGVTFPKRFGADADGTIRVSATLATRFQEIVTEFWPMFAEDMDSLVAKAKEWAKAHAVVSVAKPTTVKAGAILTEDDAEIVHRLEDSTIRTGRYNYRFYQAVSGLPRIARRWDPNSKVWGVRKEYIPNMIKELQGAGFKVSEIHTNEPTPDNFYKSSR